MPLATRPQPVRAAVPARCERLRQLTRAKAATAHRSAAPVPLPRLRFRVPRRAVPVTSALSPARVTQSGMAEPEASSIFATAVPPGALLTSPEDKRLYRRLELDNGLVAIIVHDPFMAAHKPADDADDEMEEDEEEEADEEAGEEDEDEEDEESGAEAHGGPASAPEKKAAAALAVNVGSFSDPPEAQGLSHFLEHLVFMGSERFPDENAYDSYLQQHGGGSNAYTEAEQTVFHFDCAPVAFRGALERFAAQFEAPLCAESATAREVRAVDSEFTQAQQSDGARLLQVQCAGAPAGHPAALFSWGNAKSLVADVEARGLSLRKLLLAHHSKHYRAGRMTLALVAAEPLDTLEEWVRELFGRVPSGGMPRADFAPHGGMISGSTGVLFRVPAVKEAHDLVFTFALPPLYGEYEAKPDEYASHLLGHEGAGSLLSALKARSWASALCAGVSEGGHERSSAAWLFSVGVTLTEAGLAAWRDVAALVFQYIRLLRDAGPQRLVFEELRAVKEQEFRFAEEEDGAEYVSRLAAIAERFAPAHAVAGEYLLTRFDPAGITAVLSVLTPHNCRLDLQSSSFAAATPATLAEPVDGEPGATAHLEPWMDVPFGRAPLPRALLDAWAAAPPAADLALPPRNAFLATDFALRGTGAGGAPAEDDDTAFPLVSGTTLRAPAPPLRLALPGAARFRAWHKLDGVGGRFGAPRAASFWAVTPSSHAAGGPLGEPLTHLVLKLAEDALAETTYLADVAGLRCHTTPEGARFELKVEGFSHKLPVLSAELFSALATLPQLVADEARLARVREALLRRLRNALVKPAKHAGYLRLLALRHRATPVGAQLAALQAADSSVLAAHAASALACCSVDALIMGNLTAAEASALAHAAAAALPAGQPVAPEAWPHEAVLRVPPGGAVLFAVAKNGADDNSVTESYFQVGAHAEALPDVRARALADLLAQCIGEPCFDTLRTKEQLGYTVSSGVRLTHGVLGFAVSVQSAKHGPAYLDARIDAFLASFGDTLRNMPPDEFERNRAAVISVKLQKERALIEEADRHWDAIWHRHYDFTLREREAGELAAIQRDELCAWYAAHLAPGAPRRKLCVRVAAVGRAAEERAAAATDAQSSAALFVEEEAGAEALRSAWGFFPAAEQVEPAV